MINSADDIAELDPAHILAAGSDSPPHAKLEWGDHLGKRASIGGEDHADAKVDDSQARTQGRLGCQLPGDTNPGQEVAAGGTALVEGFVNAIALESGCANGPENLRGRWQPGQRHGQ